MVPGLCRCTGRLGNYDLSQFCNLDGRSSMHLRSQPSEYRGRTGTVGDAAHHGSSDQLWERISLHFLFISYFR